MTGRRFSLAITLILGLVYALIYVRFLFIPYLFIKVKIDFIYFGLFLFLHFSHHLISFRNISIQALNSEKKVIQSNITNDVAIGSGRFLRFLYEIDGDELPRSSRNYENFASSVLWAYTPQINLSTFLHLLSAQTTNISDQATTSIGGTSTSIVSAGQPRGAFLSESDLQFLTKFIHFVWIFSSSYLLMFCGSLLRFCF